MLFCLSVCVWCGLHGHTGIMRDAGIPLAAPASVLSFVTSSCRNRVANLKAFREAPWNWQYWQWISTLQHDYLWHRSWCCHVFFSYFPDIEKGNRNNINGKMWQDIHRLFDSYLVQCLTRNGAFHNLRNDVVRLWYDICFSTSVFGMLDVAKYK